MLQNNPFTLFGITDYSQFKNYPFLEIESIKPIKYAIESQLRLQLPEVPDRLKYPDRILILGVPGIGKSTSLCYIYEMLIDAGYEEDENLFLFDKLFVDAEDFKIQKGISVAQASNKHCYILVDFPDTINSTNFKKFLDFCWILMKCQNYRNINFVFSCNISHFNRSLNLSEILNKFMRYRLEEMTEEECKWLIKSRLKMIDAEDYFEEEVYNLLFRYSKGIPRNIMSASKMLVDKFKYKESVNAVEANIVLKEGYIESIINDREENKDKKEIYKSIMNLLINEKNGMAINQSRLIGMIRKKVNIGANKSIGLLSDLCKFGLLEFHKGGERNVEKIWQVTKI